MFFGPSISRSVESTLTELLAGGAVLGAAPVDGRSVSLSVTVHADGPFTHPRSRCLASPVNGHSRMSPVVGEGGACRATGMGYELLRRSPSIGLYGGRTRSHAGRAPRRST
jgi:hypothetical protein